MTRTARPPAQYRRPLYVHAALDLIRARNALGEGGSRDAMLLLLRCAFLVVAVLVASLALWFRLPATATDTLWAEDGRVFIADAQQHGLLGATFLPYAGYLQFVPRLIATAVVHGLPVAWWAYGMTAGACLVTGGVAVVVYLASGAVLGSAVLRGILASVVILVPLGPRDVLGNPTNLHSVLFWACLWQLLATPRSSRGAFTLSVLGFAAAASEIQTVFLVPLFLPAARQRHGLIRTLGPAAGVLAQLIATIVAPRTPSTAPQDTPASIAVGYLINVVLPNLAPQRDLGSLILSGGLFLAAGVLIALTALIVVAWPRATSGQRLAIIAAITLSALVWTASVVTNPAPFYNYAAMTPTQLQHVWLTRYGVVPAMLLYSTALIATDVLLNSSRRTRGLRIVPITVAVLIALSLVANYVPTYTRRSAGPTWSSQIPAARQRCGHEPPTSTIRLQETLHWTVPVECGYLTTPADPSPNEHASQRA